MICKSGEELGLLCSPDQELRPRYLENTEDLSTATLFVNARSAWFYVHCMTKREWHQPVKLLVQSFIKLDSGNLIYPKQHQLFFRIMPLETAVLLT